MTARDRGDWIPWYLADSASWLELSLAARGAAEGIARKMGRTSGELHLGSRGLRGLALLLGCSWEELEPAITELLSGPHPRLVLSEDQRVLIDPDHASRKRPTSAERVRRHRARRAESDACNVTSVSSVADVSTPGALASSREVATDVTVTRVPSRLVSSDLSLGSDLSGRSEDPQQVTAREVEPLPDAPPAWWSAAVATAEQTTGRTLEQPAARWLEYRAARERKGWPPSQRDAVGWLAAVLAADANRTRSRARGPELTRQPVDESAPWFREAMAASGGGR